MVRLDLIIIYSSLRQSLIFRRLSFSQWVCFVREPISCEIYRCHGYKTAVWNRKADMPMPSDIAVMYLKTIQYYYMRGAKRLTNSRRVGSRNQAREKTVGWGNKSRETEAKECLMGMQYEQTLQSHADWTKDPRMLSNQWLTNMQPRNSHRGFTPNPRPSKTAQNSTKLLKKLPEQPSNPQQPPSMILLKPRTNSSPIQNPLTKSPFGNIMQQILLSRQHEYDISTQLVIPTKTAKLFRTKYYNARVAKSMKIEKQEKVDLEFRGQPEINREPVYFSTRYNQFPVRRSPTRRNFMSSQTASKLECYKEEVDPVSLEIQKLRKMFSMRKAKRSTRVGSPVRKRDSQVVVQGRKIF